MIEEKEKCCERMNLAEVIDKTDLANIAAFGIVISILGYALYTGNTELIATLIGAGITWLFKSNGSQT